MKFQFPPRSTRGAVLGFAWSQIALVMAGVITAVVALNLLVAGHRGPAISAFAGCVLLVTLGLLRFKGRRVTEWAPVVGGALLQRRAGQAEYRGGPYAPSSVEQWMDLPGPAAAYVWLNATASDGTTQIGLLHHRREKTVTAALTCFGTNLILADRDVQSQRLSDWAQLLNILGSEYADAGLIRWSVTSRAVPDTGNAAQRYLVNRAVDTSSAAYRSLAQLTAAAAPAAQRHEIYLSVVFDIARLSGEIAQAGGTDAAIAAVVLDRLTGIESAVTEAGITTGGWLSPRAYAAIIRTQFDPDDQEVVDLRASTTAAGDGPTAAGVEPRLAGPIAARTVGWNTYQHDSAFSRTLWVAQMPRQLVAATWLSPLYMRTTSRRTVSLVAQPVPAAVAQLATRREKVSRAGDEVTKRKLRLVRTAREDDEARAVEQIDREQAAGHVRYRYALLVTVTAATMPDLDRDVRSVKRILSRAGCEAIVLAGEQDQAFAAGALPLARGLKPARGWSA
ncbi:SCO6880 family protein [Actinoplanes rectilineatus]|uniref:SCO6880 family protein n=1 Tax=Actinoplanes rectilineatus TaxID=113571 RepID=UPI0005F27938|nr:SCO6880 family protein [Actinoplanes rectilineatus]